MTSQDVEFIREKYERVEDESVMGSRFGAALDRQTRTRLSYTEVGLREGVSKYKVQRALARPLSLEELKERSQRRSRYWRDWLSAHPSEQKRYMHNHMRRYADLRGQVIERLGGKCVGCGITDIRLLCVNHKNGDGHHDRKLFKGIRRFDKAILNGQRKTDDLDLRCFNCNVLYEYERRKKGVLVKDAKEGKL